MTDTTTMGVAESRGPEPATRWRLTAEFLDSCIQSAGRAFQKGELVYLAMTSQIENPIRDRVAYEMHLKLMGTRLDVGREWTGLYAEDADGRPRRRKVDLAVVEKPKRRGSRIPLPEGVVEFKACYAHEARSAGQLKKIYRGVHEDVVKSAAWGSAIMGEVFSVVLIPNLRIVTDRFPHQIMRKIEGKIRLDDFLRQIGEVGDEVTVREISSRLSDLGPVRDGVIDAGSDSGVQVTVPYVILGPVPVETYENLPLLQLPQQQRGRQKR
ncbi:hypothetical protein LT966_28585 [Streptomyces griseobrunneus]